MYDDVSKITFIPAQRQQFISVVVINKYHVFSVWCWRPYTVFQIYCASLVPILLDRNSESEELVDVLPWYLSLVLVSE